MATKDQIPTPLALEIGDDLEPRRFVAACKEFFGLTDELANFHEGEKSATPWRVKVREGSNIVALDIGVANNNNVLSATLARVYEGANALAVGDMTSPLLSEKAIAHAKRLSDLTKVGKHVVPMRLWIAHRPISYGPEIGEIIRQDESSTYEDFGTIEGVLRAISDQAGGLEIRVHDKMWPRPIPCRVSDEQVGEAMGAFRQRVEVSGMIHYNRNGRPTSIRMDALSMLPDDAVLPTALDVRGLFI